MELETYNQTLKALTSKLTQVMDQIDAVDPADDRYESLNDKMIAIQNELIQLDAQYNAERKQ